MSRTLVNFRPPSRSFNLEEKKPKDTRVGGGGGGVSRDCRVNPSPTLNRVKSRVKSDGGASRVKTYPVFIMMNVFNSVTLLLIKYVLMVNVR